MNVAVSELRAHLGDWLDRARRGEEVVVTERGVPVARVIGIGGAPAVERLIRDGTVSRPRVAHRPPARGQRRIRAQGPVAELVSEDRR